MEIESRELGRLGGPVDFIKQRVFLAAAWRKLVMFNYEVDPALLRPLTPAGTELDFYDGAAILSLVAFRFENTRLVGVPVPGHMNFEEINLRFYVRRTERDGAIKRGVVFIKEIVPKPMLSLVARVFYNEQYETYPASSHFISDADDPERLLTLEYGWGNRRGSASVRVATDGVRRPILPGTEEYSITQHFWGYAAQRDGGTMEYEVAHPVWNAWGVRSGVFQGDVSHIYGRTFQNILAGRPRSMFAVDGSEIAVFRGHRLPP